MPVWGGAAGAGRAGRRAGRALLRPACRPPGPRRARRATPHRHGTNEWVPRAMPLAGVQGAAPPGLASDRSALSPATARPWRSRRVAWGAVRAFGSPRRAVRPPASVRLIGVPSSSSSCAIMSRWALLPPSRRISARRGASRRTTSACAPCRCASTAAQTGSATSLIAGAVGVAARSAVRNRSAAAVRPVAARASIRCGSSNRCPVSPMRASALSASSCQRSPTVTPSCSSRHSRAAAFCRST